MYGFLLYLGVSVVSYFYALFFWLSVCVWFSAISGYIWVKLFLCIVFGCLYVYGFLLYLCVSGVSYFYALFFVVCICMVFCCIWGKLLFLLFLVVCISMVFCCIWGKLFLCIVFGCPLSVTMSYGLGVGQDYVCIVVSCLYVWLCAATVYCTKTTTTVSQFCFWLSICV